jgi:hypothetical protein
MKLIDDAGILWHRLWSVRLSALTTLYTSAAGAWLVLPPDWKPTLTHTEQVIMAGIGMLLPALATVAPVVKQQSLADLRAKVATNDNSEQA